MNTDFIKKIFRFNLGLAFVEGLLVFWQYIQTPSESAAAVFLGFSPLRLAILFGVAVILGLTGYLLLSTSRPLWWDQRPGKMVVRLFEWTEMFWLLLSALVFLYFLIFSTDPYLGFVANYRERLFPILIWLAVVVFQFILSWLYARTLGSHFFESFRNILIPAGIAFLFILAVISFIGVTRLGLTPDEVYWQEAGVPILFAQILLIVAIGGLLHVTFTRFNLPDNKKNDAVIFIALWVITFAIWAGTTAKPAYNNLEPAPPNFQSYPFGDAMLYDVTAQNFLIGKPIPADFWAKPLYSFFLSILHLVAGQNVGLVTLLQVAFLAGIPSLIYLLTKILGGRLSGIVAALLIMLREWNSISLSNVIQVSHVKLLLSDVFAMGGMVLLTWLMLRWLEKPSTRGATPMAAGGAMGFLILMRGHPVLIVPVLFMIGFVLLRKNSHLMRDGLWNLTVGLSLVMLPWFWHTYDLTGRFAFQDNTSSFARMDAFVQTYADSSDSDPASYGQFEAQIIQQVLTQPMEVARFVSSHYLHNTVFSYIFLPQSFQVESLRSYVKRLPFWGNWAGELSVESWVLMLIHGSILALGLGTAWKRTKGSIFIPILIGAAYNLSVSVSRRSAWRFIQPADWVTLVFYSIGLVQLILIISSIIKRSAVEEMEQRDQAEESAAAPSKRWSYALSGMPFLFIVLALVLGHKAFPLSYPAKETVEMMQMYRDTARGTSRLDDSQVEQFIQQENAVIVHGKALYPVYFKSNVGALNYSWLSFAPRPYKRLAFYVIGPEPAGVIFPADSLPTTFPDGADVLVLGCRNEAGDIEALSVAITSTDAPIVYDREAMPPLTCPFAEPE